MVSKSGGGHRFCIDFRAINNVTSPEGMGHPLPNIEEMLNRQSDKHAKYFGVLDSTAGYFQAPTHPDVRKFTAFIAFCGLYEWLRVPMGSKGAPTYFSTIDGNYGFGRTAVFDTRSPLG